MMYLVTLEVTLTEHLMSDVQTTLWWDIFKPAWLCPGYWVLGIHLPFGRELELVIWTCVSMLTSWIVWSSFPRIDFGNIIFIACIISWLQTYTDGPVSNTLAWISTSISASSVNCICMSITMERNVEVIKCFSDHLQDLGRLTSKFSCGQISSRSHGECIYWSPSDVLPKTWRWAVNIFPIYSMFV